MLDPKRLALQHGSGASLGKVDLRQRFMRLVSAQASVTSETPLIAGERNLVERLRKGDPAAFDQVYREQHRVLRAYAQRLIGDVAAAEDLVHDVFVRLPTLLARFRLESSLRSYLLGVATRIGRRHVQTAMRRRKLLARLAAAPASAPPGPERTHELQRFQTLLDSLPLGQRAAFVLCELEEHSGREAAEILGVPEATVRTRCFHARKRLKALLEGDAP